MSILKNDCPFSGQTGTVSSSETPVTGATFSPLFPVPSAPPTAAEPFIEEDISVNLEENMVLENKEGSAHFKSPETPDEMVSE
jgi:hypothetical protein